MNKKKYIDKDFMEDCKKIRKYLTYKYMKNKYYSLYDIKWIKFTVKIIIKKLERYKND